MKNNGVTDVNVVRYSPLVSPRQIIHDVPRTEAAYELVKSSRDAIQSILDGKDERLLAIVGPCSLHDAENAQAYASAIRPVAEKVANKIYVVMRAYFEKPRTSLGWKGLINDPHLDGTYDINEGYREARRILNIMAKEGMSAATEYLETITPQYNSDMIAWAAIGARTAYSPVHRELASGLSMPVGIKNDTHGDISVAVNGVIAARDNHVFPGLDPDGNIALIYTRGNAYAHIVLRGGDTGPNYDQGSVEKAQKMLSERGIPNRLIIDCSHDNTLVEWETEYKKDYKRQVIVFQEGIRQRVDGNKGVVGLMVESHIEDGNQPVPVDLSTLDKSALRFGTSITDKCLPLETTIKLLEEAYSDL
ncbi:3-deoxy-7-phosphoheptulonate synthase [Candidatus Woesearchaeota archaeon]|nr:3-deoxy-7-phosphoheptulonate synthase [Candidatus Woesearchaeota archaeon]